jgi:hypothetical protein
VAVIFRVRPRSNLRLREIRIDPNSFGLNPVVPRESPINWLKAHQIAMEAQRELNAREYPNARVREELHEAGEGRAELHLTVAAGENMRVKSVRVELVGQAIARGHADGVPASQ